MSMLNNRKTKQNTMLTTRGPGSICPRPPVPSLQRGNIETKIAQTWHMSHATILDFSPLNGFFSRLIDIPCKNDTV